LSIARPVDSAPAPLWLVDLDQVGEAQTQRFASLLDAEERERAGRFGLVDRRLQHIVAHGLKRLVLGKIAGAPPEALRFGLGDFGKPHLLAHPRIDFSLSHCNGLVGVAVSIGGQVGLDLESGDRVIDDPIAARYFSLSEQAAAKVDRIRLWTLKEAYVKATGDGITEAFNRCTAALNPARIDAVRPCQAWQGRVARNHIASVVLIDPTATV